MRSTSQRRLLCLPASGKPNTDMIIYFFSFFCIFFYYFIFIGSVGKLATDESCYQPSPCPLKQYQPTLENMSVPTSHEAYQPFCVSHVPRVRFKINPKVSLWTRSRYIAQRLLAASACAALMSNSRGIRTESQLSRVPVPKGQNAAQLPPCLEQLRRTPQKWGRFTS